MGSVVEIPMFQMRPKPRMSKPRTPVVRRPGFTLVELLVTVAIIIVLLSILVAALLGVTRGGQKARTQFQMSNISTALVQFENTIGYLPPVLDMNRNMILPPPLPGGSLSPTEFANQVQDWFSYTSLAEYLVGPGDRTEDGYGFVGGSTAVPPANPSPGGEQEFPRNGFRYPGDDGVWGSLIDPKMGTPGLGLFISRNLSPASGSPNAYTNRYLQGSVYGPFIEMKDDRLMGGLSLDVNGNPQMDADGYPVVVFPGEVDNFESLPKVIVDYWGRPIRYYRTLYPPPLVKTQYKPLPANLGDVIALRPMEFSAGTDTDTTVIGNQADLFADDNDDTSTSRILQSARFAMLSYGPNRKVNSRVRADVDGFNFDNLVEVGP